VFRKRQSKFCEQSKELQARHYSLMHGLPVDFDFTIIRDADRATAFIWDLPNRDRGKAARGLYRARKIIGSDAAFAGMMAAWQHDHPYVAQAFGSSNAFARALKRVAPPHGRTGPIRAWRGVLLEKEDPYEAALEPSWTTNRDTAAWFAMRFYKDGLRPFVFYADFEPDHIVAFNDNRKENEVITHQFSGVFIDHGTSPLALSRDAVASPAAISVWQERFEREKERRQKAH
jgi:hypothetical protein